MVLARVGLTGASGMLGGHLLSEFSQRGISVVATSRSTPATLPTGSAWSPWDLQEEIGASALDGIFPDVQALVHAGATVPAPDRPERSRDLLDANVRSALVLGEWALSRGLPVVLISGAIVYSDPDRVGILEGDDVGPCGFGGFYGTSKFMCELIFQHLEREGLKLCILRPSSIYGRGLSPSKMISRFLAAAATDEVIELSPPFDDAVDFVHARDVAVATIQAVQTEAVGIYNIASGDLSSVRAVAETCIDVVGRGRVKLTGAPTRAPTLRFGLDCSAAAEAFSFSPVVRLRGGLADLSTSLGHGGLV